jgi:hypothetical protein
MLTRKTLTRTSKQQSCYVAAQIPFDDEPLLILTTLCLRPRLAAAPIVIIYIWSDAYISSAYCTYYLDHGAPAVCGVQRVQAAGEDVVVAVGRSQNGVDLRHSQALVEVVQMGAVEVYFSFSFAHSSVIPSAEDWSGMKGRLPVEDCWDVTDKLPKWTPSIRFTLLCHDKQYMPKIQRAEGPLFAP